MVIKFTGSNNSFSFTSSRPIYFAMVGGGASGGGGNNNGNASPGGGSGGGVYYNKDRPIQTNANTTYNVTVGAGGVGVLKNTGMGTAGGTSSIIGGELNISVPGGNPGIGFNGTDDNKDGFGYSGGLSVEAGSGGGNAAVKLPSGAGGRGNQSTPTAPPAGIGPRLNLSEIGVNMIVSSGGAGGNGGSFNAPGNPGNSSGNLPEPYQQRINNAYPTNASATDYGCGGGGAAADVRNFGSQGINPLSGAGAPGCVWIWFNSDGIA